MHHNLIKLKLIYIKILESLSPPPPKYAYFISLHSVPTEIAQLSYFQKLLVTNVCKQL